MAPRQRWRRSAMLMAWGLRVTGQSPTACRARRPTEVERACSGSSSAAWSPPRRQGSMARTTAVVRAVHSVTRIVMADRASASRRRRVHRFDGHLALAQLLDGLGQVAIVDVIVPGRHTDAVRRRQDIGDGEAIRRHEFVAGQLEKLPVRVAEIDRVHEAAIDRAGVLDATLFSPLDHLCIDRVRDRQRHVMQIAVALWLRRRIVLARGTDEVGEQTAVPSVEIQVFFPRHVQVRLVEHQPHTEETLVELDDSLTVRSDEREVMHALYLESAHDGASWDLRSGISVRGLPAPHVRATGRQMRKNRRRALSVTCVSPLASPASMRPNVVSTKSEASRKWKTAGTLARSSAGA